MAQIDLGKIKPIWKGDWTTGTAYEKNDMVKNGANSYIATAAHTAGATFSGDSANWDTMAQGADIPAQTGNAGKALVTDGTTLSWGNGGSLVPLATHRVSGITANVVFTNVFTSDYDVFFMTCTKMVVSTDNGALYMRFTKNGNGTVHTDADYRSIVGGLEVAVSGQNDTQARASWNQQEFQWHPAGGNTTNNAGTGGINYNLYFHRPYANEWTNVTGSYVATRQQLDTVMGGDFAGQCTTSTAMDGIQLSCSGGFSEGIFQLYGIAGA